MNTLTFCSRRLPADSFAFYFSLRVFVYFQFHAKVFAFLGIIRKFYFFHFQAELREFEEMRKDRGKREYGGSFSDGEDED